MFNFFQDIANYKDRAVDRWEEGPRLVSTAAVSDGSKPYETAFKHPDYNDGDMVIVEAYYTRESAIEGHQKWVKVMVDGPLPDVLTDCQNAEISKLMDNVTFPRKKEGPK